MVYVWLHGATHPGLRPPLSERGWRGGDLLIIKTMRQPIPSRRGVHGVRGVSHCQVSIFPGGGAPSNAANLGCVALSNWLSVESGQSVFLLRGRFAQNFNKIFFKIIQICYDEGKALQKCRFCAVSTSVVVRLLSARCPVVVQSLTGQQLDNNWTTTGQRAKEVL